MGEQQPRKFYVQGWGTYRACDAAYCTVIEEIH
jgi:hypothetical protein